MQIPLKRGMVLRHQGHLFYVQDYQERHSGKMKPTVHVALRNVVDGHPVDRTLDDLLPLQEVEHVYRPMQYLYQQGDRYTFMDLETFDQIELSDAQLRGGQPFLAEGAQYRVLFTDGRPLYVELPDTILLRVSMTAAPEHSVGNSASVQKEATLENGLQIRVPLFIKTGDHVRVNTRDKSYAGKELKGH